MTLGRFYRLTSVFAAVGFVWQFGAAGPRAGLGFLVGAAGSFGNLLLFDWLSRSIAPGEHSQKPWQASLFVGRYIVLVAAGYVTVNTLGVSPLPVLLGLLASTAAVLTSSIIDLVGSLRGNRPQ